MVDVHGSPSLSAAPIEAAIAAQGLRIPIANLTTRLGGCRGYQRFLEALTVTEKVQPGRPKTSVRDCRIAYFIDPLDPGFIYVPRVKVPILLGSILTKVTTPTEAYWVRGRNRIISDASWHPAQPFYDYQEAAADHICSVGEPLETLGAVYVQMGTGMGKSRFGMAVAARGRGPVFVVVPTKVIRLQWMNEFAEVFPGLSIAAYDNYPKKSKKIPPSPVTHDIVVGIVNTVRMKKSGFFAGYTTVILDEAHELSSSKNTQVLWLAQEAPRVLGLSATPDERSDGLDRVIFHFLGHPVYAETDIPGFDITDVSFLGRVREIEYEGHPDYCETTLSATGTVSAIKTIGNVIRDPSRLKLVAAEVERIFNLHETEPAATLAEFGLGSRPATAATPKYPEGEPRIHGVFVFAEHRDYLPALRDALLERFTSEDVKVPELDDPVPVVLRGGATRTEIGSAHKARIVLTTYGYSRRGVSIVEMTAIVLATPRRNGMRQILGRITRRGSDESIIRLVIDIKDIHTALKSQNTDRRKVYKEKEYPIYQVRANYTNFLENRMAALTTEEKLVWKPTLTKLKEVNEYSAQMFDFADL